MVVDLFMKRALHFSHVEDTAGAGHEIDHSNSGVVHAEARLKALAIGKHACCAFLNGYTGS